MPGHLPARPIGCEDMQWPGPSSEAAEPWLSPAKWAFIPKYHWLPFFVWRHIGVAFVCQFLVEGVRADSLAPDGLGTPHSQQRGDLNPDRRASGNQTTSHLVGGDAAIRVASMIVPPRINKLAASNALLSRPLKHGRHASAPGSDR